MAWEARSGLKSQARSGLKQSLIFLLKATTNTRLNGLGSPFGFETG